MKETKLMEIGKLTLVKVDYGEDVHNIEFQHVECSPDPYFSDSSVETKIEKEDALRLIANLSGYFGI